MGLLLVLGLVVAWAPDAGETAASEAYAAVASCVLPSVLADAARASAEFSEGPVGRRVRFHEVDGPSGSGKYVMYREWLVTPGSCRRVALQLDCAGGNPSCSASVLHLPGQPPTDAERELLLSWLGGGRRDPRRPEHQAAMTPGPLRFPPPPEVSDDVSLEEAEAPVRSRASRNAASFMVRAVTQPPPRWMRGPPVPQALSWAESSIFAEKEESSDGLEGFVSSGRFYTVHRGNCCVREDEVREVGAARLRFFSSPSRPMQKVTYVVLEQPKRNRSAWLLASESGLRLLGVHQRRAWLEVPVFMDPGFSLVAIDLDTGAAWHLELERTPTFDPDAYRAGAVAREGLRLEDFAEDAPGPSKTVPWALLERAIQNAKPPAR